MDERISGGEAKTSLAASVQYLRHSTLRDTDSYCNLCLRHSSIQKVTNQGVPSMFHPPIIRHLIIIVNSTLI